MTTTEARSKIYTHVPGDQPHEAGRGTSRMWTRVIRGRKYGFTAVTMPDGELRWSVSHFDAPEGTANFGCYWTRLHFITIKPEARAAIAAGPLSDAEVYELESRSDRLDEQAQQLYGRADVWRQLRNREGRSNCKWSAEYLRLDRRHWWAELAGARLSRAASRAYRQAHPRVFAAQGV